jgi:hypothetical protein
MGKAGYDIKEIRFVIEPELTQAYYLVEAWGNCPIGVQGWHHKTFPKSKAVIDILEDHKKGIEDPVLWPLEAPDKD